MPPRVRVVRKLLLLGAVVAWIAGAQETPLSVAARLDAEHKCDEAEQIYQKLLAAGSPAPALLNNLGNHYLTCGAPDKARSYFEQLVKANPAHVNANLQLARLAVDRKEGAKALTYLARIKAPDPEVLVVRVEALAQTGLQAAAVGAANEAAKMAAGNPSVLFALGMACGRSGLYEPAEAAFNAVAATYPGDYDVLYNLGVAAARAEHYERARSALEVALKIREDDPDALTELGRVESNLGDYNRAVYLLVRARTLAPQRADAALALARAAQAGGYLGDSELAYDDYLKLKPNDDLARRDRAFVLGYSESTRSQGLKELSTYVQRHPSDAIAYFDLAQISYHSNPELALGQASKAVALDPSLEPAHYVKAWLLHRLGRDEEALPELQIATRLNSHDALAYDLLGLTYMNLDKPEQSERALRQAATLSPTDPKILLHLARALGDSGHDSETQQLLAEFRKAQPNGPQAPRQEAGIIESAALSPAERSRRTIEQLQQLIVKNPGEPSLKLDLGTALLIDGKQEEGRLAFAELLAMNPSSELSYKAGTTLLGLEQYALAAQFLKRSDLKSAAGRLDLAMALLFSEGPGKAVEALDQVREEERSGDYFLLKAQIEEAAGRSAEADKLIEGSLRFRTFQPKLAQASALLLLRHGQKATALRLVDQALKAEPDDADLIVTRGMILGFLDRNAEAYRTLRRLESRLPEWDAPYLVEGLLLERESRREEARQRIKIAFALGTTDPAAQCALNQMDGLTSGAGRCACVTGIYQAFFSDCQGP